VPGLQKRVLEQDFLKGLDTKTDPKDINDGRMLLIQNGVLTLGTSIRKRNGFTALSNLDINGNPITVGSGLSTFQNELIELNPWSLFSFEQASGKWVPKALMPMGMTSTAQSVIRNNSTQTLGDCASSGKTAVYAYEDSTGGVRITVIDETTGNIVQNNVLLDPAGTMPRVLTSGSSCFVFYITGVNIKAVTITDAAPQTLPAPSAALNISAITTAAGYDVCPDGAGAFVCAYRRSSDGNIVVLGESIAMVHGTATNFAPGAGVNGIALSQNQNIGNTLGGCIVLALIEGLNIETVSWSTGTFAAAVLSVKAVRYTGTTAIVQATVLGTGTGGSHNIVAEEAASTGTGSAVVRMSVNGAASVFVAKAQHLCSCGFSQLVDDANHGATNQADFVVITNVTANLQPKYFVIRVDAGNRSAIYGKFLENAAGGAPPKTRTFVVNLIGPLATPVAGKYALAASSQFALTAVNGSFVTQTGVTRVTLDASLPLGYFAQQLGGNLHVPGSAMQSYDGGVVTEQNFHHYPEGGSAQGTGATVQYGQLGTTVGGVGGKIVGPSQVQVNWGNATTVLNPESSILPSAFHPIQFSLGYGDQAYGTDFDYYQFQAIDANGATLSTPDAGYFPIQVHYYFNAQGVLVQDSSAQVARAVQTTINWVDGRRVRAGANRHGCYGATFFGANQDGTTKIILMSPNPLVSPPPAACQIEMPWAFSNQFTVFDTQTAADTQFMAFPDGAHIKGGQWFSMQSINVAAAPTTYHDFYFWFIVDGVGTNPSPAPPDPVTGWFANFSITINSTDSASAVATAVNARINAVAAADFTCSRIDPLMNGINVGTGFVVQVDVARTSSTATISKIATNNNVTGTMPAGTYSYLFVFKWLDNQGQIHRSAPSQPISVTVSADGYGGVFGTVVLRVPTLKLTGKQAITSSLTPANPATGALIEIYRTAPSKSGGNVYYNLTPGNTAVANAPSLDTAPTLFQDSAKDEDIIGNEQLYCNGNIPLGAYYPPPPHKFVFHHRDRLICGGLEDPYQLAFSRKKSPGIGANFHPVQVVNLEPAGGPITAAGSLDDKLIIFQGGQLWAILGDGPDDNGGSQQFSLPQLVSSQTGAVNQGSLEVLPTGLVFKSSKGIFLIDRKLTLQYIGADVEGYNALTINDGQTVSNTTQVRFTASSNTTLVYDFYYGQWTTFQLGTNAATQPVAQALYNGVYYYLEADGVVQQEMPGQFNDNGVAIVTKVQSGWFNFAGMNGFQRLDRFSILGTFTPGATISIGCKYNYDDSFTDPLALVIASPGIQIRANTRRPKSMALSLIIQDVPTAGTQDFIVSGVSFLAKVKTGLFKPAQNSMTG
jgi:hypothetical protein